MSDTNNPNLEPIEHAIPDVKSIDEIPGSIFDPDVVRASGIRQLREMEDRHNFNRRQHYLRAVANWERNFFEQGRRGRLPEPILAIHYRYVEADKPEIVEGPDFVAEPYSPPLPPAPLPEGIVAFGFEIGDGSGGYYVGPTNTVRPGTHAVKDGTEYVFVRLGKRGTLIFREMWIPVGN